MLKQILPSKQKGRQEHHSDSEGRDYCMHAVPQGRAFLHKHVSKAFSFLQCIYNHEEIQG